MFFDGSGTFEHFPAKHLLGILKNRSRKTTKKTIIFTIISGLCYAFLGPVYMEASQPGKRAGSLYRDLGSPYILCKKTH